MVTVHDEIGRGNFLSLYLSSGVIGSLVSLTSHVLLQRLTVTSLGASGAIAGLVAAWCMLHSEYAFPSPPLLYLHTNKTIQRQTRPQLPPP
jgi:membrane associated rhomboid family serine protease